VHQLAQPPSVKAPAERFTGDAWVDGITTASPPSRLTAALVRFAPGARTAWHRHAVGQTLHVTEGLGVAASRAGSVIVLRPGDTVHTPPGEWHWHGAAPDRFMTHLALSESSSDPDTPDVEWSEHVTDTEYRNATGLL
jgi:quercetin dioxygenase-like cupin family protein